MSRYLVFDIGGTSVKYGVLNGLGEIKEKGSFATPSTSLNELFDIFEKLYLEFDKEEKILGIGISSPGAVDTEIGVVNGVSAVPYLHGPNIINELKKRINLPIAIENDANCAALAEVWIGEASQNNDVAFIVIGTGIGGAIVKDKKIHRGKNLHGGEFGIMYFPKKNGEHGIWGDNSIGQLTKEISKYLKKDIDGMEVFRIAEENSNDYVTFKVQEWFENIAKGILIIQHVYDPEKIIIGGGVSSKSGLTEKIDVEIKKISNKIPEITIKPDVKVCKFNNDANLIGALYNLLLKEKVDLK